MHGDQCRRKVGIHLDVIRNDRSLDISAEMRRRPCFLDFGRFFCTPCASQTLRRVLVKEAHELVLGTKESGLGQDRRATQRHWAA